MPRKLLVVAFHFPPLQGSTGIYRTLSFAKHLPRHGWDVAVLTANSTAYPQTRAENLSVIPVDTRVIRAWALDTQRHLAIRGRYPQLLATPDRWLSWIPSAIAAGVGEVLRWHPDAIMSTYPIPSAHCIGLALRRLCRVPWVADFRDPMLQDNYPREATLRTAYRRIEQATFARADRITVTTPGTAELYLRRYVDTAAGSVHVIPNGFDEELFAGATPAADSTAPDAVGGRMKLRLLHSGLLYPHERNPENFFRAMAEARSEGRIHESEVEVVLRASGNEAAYRSRLEGLGLASLIHLLPPVPYREALSEMLAADACLVFQADNCNQQIPAKIYEYLYARKPILAFADPQGDTGRTLASVGIRHIAALEDKDAIKRCLLDFLAALRTGSAPRAPMDAVMAFSRRAAAAQLAKLLDEMLVEVSAGSRGRASAS